MPSRRAVVTASAALLSMPLIGRFRPIRAATGAAPFGLGIASGDPTTDSIILWTRLTSLPPAGEGGEGPVEVEWTLAEDPALTRQVRRGTAFAWPDRAHAVHVDVGGLSPDRWYWYRFRAGGEESPLGRTRTLPAPGEMPAEARFAVVSCQHWENGYFNAYRGLGDDERTALVLHLGDYVYEVGRGGVRQHDRPGRPRSLAEWRARYALYKTDPDLQAAHAAFPFLCVPDNHDAAEDDDESPAGLTARAAAYQAWYEHMPVRAPYQPGSPTLPLARALDFGRLAHLTILDTRQFRDPQEVCRAGGADPDFAFGIYQRPCPAQEEEGRSMLGRPQEAWLRGRLGGGVWNTIASTIPFGPFDIWRGPDRYRYAYSWDGYPAERERVLRALADSGATNPIILSGDVHSNWVKSVRAPGRPDAPVVATEFVGTSISSVWPEPLDRPFRESMGRNPDVSFYDSSRRGYLLCTLTPDLWTTDLMTADTTADPKGTVRRDRSFVVEAGRPEARPA